MANGPTALGLGTPLNPPYSGPAGASTPIQTWGPTPLIIIGGVLVLGWLGTTRAAPVVVAFLLAILAYWVLNSS